jgi:hypothetical protein
MAMTISMNILIKTEAVVAWGLKNQWLTRRKATKNTATQIPFLCHQMQARIMGM